MAATLAKPTTAIATAALATGERGATECGGWSVMLLMDASNLAVYSLPESAITTHGAGMPKPHPVSVAHFEEAANKSCSDLIGLAAQGPGKHHPRSIAFVHLKSEDGGRPKCAWATRICVAHVGEYPALSDDFLGLDFLLLWPYPVAIHSWLAYKERERCDPLLDPTSRMIVDHPPSLLRERGLADVAHEGVVAPRDMSLGQRYFVASIGPNLPHFALRQSGDDWCKRVSELNAQLSAPWPASTHAHLPPPPPPARRAPVPIDLPDELVGRILSLRLAGDLGAIEQAVATVAALSAVSRQFRACTRDALASMLARVQPLCTQLCAPDPRSPAWIRNMLRASGLTLSSASVPGLGKWPTYVRERRKLVKHECEQWCPSGYEAKRHALLWD